MAVPDCNGTFNIQPPKPLVLNQTYNATVNATALAEARYQLKLSMAQPSYPIGATNVILNTTIWNTLQEYGTYPRCVQAHDRHKP